MSKEKSCGSVIYKYLNQRLLFLIAKMNHGHTSLIKGHVEDGESEIMTAYREIKEETNLDVVIDSSFRKVISYSPHKERPEIIKDVVFFLATPLGGRTKCQKEEVSFLRWLPFHKAIVKLTHETDRSVLRAANEHLVSNPRQSCTNMNLVRLTLPAPQYMKSYLETRVFNESGDGFVNAAVANVLERIRNARHGQGLPNGWVPGTYLWLVNKNEYLGEISIRHDLTDGLLRFGGNIGYRIRQDKRQQGYGVKMLNLALDYIKEILPLKKVLITCNDDNYGSIKVIERNGGHLFDKIENNVDGKITLTRRYWIDI